MTMFGTRCDELSSVASLSTSVTGGELALVQIRTVRRGRRSIASGHSDIGAIGRDAANLGIDLIEPRGDLRRIFDMVLGQGPRRDHNHSGVALHRQVPLAPNAKRPWHRAIPATIRLRHRNSVRSCQPTDGRGTGPPQLS